MQLFTGLNNVSLKPNIITFKSVLNSLFSVSIQATVSTFSSSTSLNYILPPYYYSPISSYRY